MMLLPGRVAEGFVEDGLHPIYGPIAYQLARRRHPDLVLPVPAERFPNWHPPAPPFVPDRPLAQQTLWLRRVYVYSMSHAGWDEEACRFLALTSDRHQAELEVAVGFFTGQARPGLSEHYQDGRRKIPEQIAPHVWCGFSAECWRFIEARRRRQPQPRRPPPLSYVFGPSRFQDPKLINFFTHWPGGDHRQWSAPLKLHAAERAERIFSLYTERLATQGWGCRADLVELRAEMVGKFAQYERLERAGQLELQRLSEAAAKLLDEGMWVWR